jgi:hypothetical protein
MKSLSILIFVLTLLFLIPSSVGAQGESSDPAGQRPGDPCVSIDRSEPVKNPYVCHDYAQLQLKTLSYRRLSQAIRSLADQKREDTLYYLQLAELMKGAGNPRADLYYRKAIDSDPDEPALRLFYADYLRNYRGPQRPLFPKAENEYLEALTVLRRRDAKQMRDWDDETARRVERGLIALYQEEGIPIRADNNVFDWIRHPRRPLLFFSTINDWAEATGDFDNVDDVRAFTSEAILAAQRRVETGLPSLTKSELKSIARVRPQYDTLQRLRFRYKSLPAFEVGYRRREIERGAITLFLFPGQTNDVRIGSEYGAALEKPFSLPSGVDLFVRGRYARIDRTGLIEGLPNAHEFINQYEAVFAGSRFIGPDKAIFQASYVFQDINPSLASIAIAKRDRHIVSGKITYELLRKLSTKRGDISDQPVARRGSGENRFELRGWEFFGGVTLDDERFGSVILHRNDYFGGSEIKGLFSGRLDLGYQATVFTSEVSGNTLPPNLLKTRIGQVIPELDIDTQDLIKRRNIQLRHNATVLFRVKDEETEPSIPSRVAWLHPASIRLVIPFKYDKALDRVKPFENFRIGCELDIKLYTAPFRGTTYRLSAGYSRQVFFNIGKSVNLMKARFSVGL